MLPRSDKVTKEFLVGETESGSETEKHFSLDSGALSQDLDSDEVMLITNSIINAKKPSKVAIMPPAEEQVNALAQVNVDQQESTVPTNQVANQAEGVIADQVAAFLLGTYQLTESQLARVLVILIVDSGCVLTC